MIAFVKKLMPAGLRRLARRIVNERFDGYAFKSYSQEGEDMMLRRLFENQPAGFYVDVGAHHPFRFSNTCYFYKRGWSGINIDAMPGSMSAFKRFRPRDINLEIPVSNTREVLTFYVFNEPALNGFSKELSLERQQGKQGFFIREELKLQTFKLSEILDRHLPAGQAIDFLSIDAEGHDFEVLKSNDWGKCKPKAVLVEIYGGSLQDIGSHEIAVYLRQQGYLIFAKSLYTVIFVCKDIHAALFNH